VPVAFTLALSSPPAGSVIASGGGVCTIYPGGIGPAVSSVSAASGNEGTSLVHTVTLASAVSGVPATYAYSLGGGTSTSASDYTVPPTFSAGVTLSGATLTVPVGVSSFTVTVAALTDGATEGSETYNLTIGGVTGVGTIGDVVGGSLITPSLTISQYSVIEGQGIFLDATATVAPAITANPYHDLKYRWVVSDGNTATHSYGLFAGRPRNVIYGPVGAYVCTIPGTHTIQLQVTAVKTGGVVDYTTLTSSTITVQSADAAFPGSATYCVAKGALPVAGVNGVPAGATCLNYSTWSQVAGLTTTSNRRILLRRGDTWDANVYTNTAASNVLFGSYGSGADPIISNSAAYEPFQLISCHNWIIQDLKFVGVSGGYQECVATSGSGMADLTFNRLEIDNMGGISGSHVDGFYFSEINGHDYQGGGGFVGIYAEYSYRVGIISCRVYDATNIEHNIRMQGVNKCAITNSTLFQAGTAAGGGKQLITIRGWSGQATGGSETTWFGVWTDHVYIADNDIDGGTAAGTGMGVEFAPQNAGSNEYVRTIIFECNKYQGKVGTGIGSEAITGITVRNNLFNIYSNDTYPGSVVFPYSRNNYISPAGSNHWVYNNSCYCRSTTTNKFGFIDITKDGPLDWPTFWARNNAVYAPFATQNLDATGTAGKFFANTEGAGGSYYDIATNSSDAQIKGTNPFSVSAPSSVADFIPSGYPVAAGDFILGNFENINRVQNGATRNMGAI